MTPGYQDKQTTEFNRDRLVKLPKGWEWIRVGDLAMGDIQTGPFGAQLHRSDKGWGALDQLDQSIIAKALRGELVPQDPSDEPVSYC
jgi:hypothetical protein